MKLGLATAGHWPIWTIVFCIITLKVECKKTNSSLELAKSEELKDLIIKATLWFPKGDLSTKGYPVFTQRVKKRGTIYSNRKRPSWRLKTKTRDAETQIVLIDKGTEDKEPLDSHVFIVLIKTKGFKSKYTAHKAYVRDIDGNKSVEWDMYDKGLDRKDYQNIFTAFTPSDFLESKKTKDGHENKHKIEESDDSESSTQKSFYAEDDEKNSDDLSTTTEKPERTKPSKTLHGKKYKTTTERSENMESAEQKGRLLIHPAGLETSEEFDGDKINENKTIVIQYVCPKGSGAVVIESKCRCPPWTKLHKGKCTQKRKHKDSFEAEESETTTEANAEKKKCPPGTKRKGKKCRKLTVTEDWQNDFGPLEISDLVLDEEMAFSYTSKSQNLTKGCPKRSGAVFENKQCVCPKGSAFSKSRRKCVSGYISSKSEKVAEGREMMNLTESKDSGESTATEEPEITTTEEHTTTKEIVVPSTEESTTEEWTERSNVTEAPIPYIISEDEIPPTKTDREFENKESDSSSESTESDLDPSTSTTAKPTEKTTKPYHDYEKIDGAYRVKSKHHEITLAIEDDNSGTPKTKVIKYKCPSESGAILKGDRCYCPKGKVLKQRKCIHRKESKEPPPVKTKPEATTKKPASTDEFFEPPFGLEHPSLAEASESTLDILVMNHIKKRGTGGKSGKKNKKGKGSGETGEKDKKGFKMDELRQSLATYSIGIIGNNKTTGHPLFESPKAPYTGIMNCKFEEKRVKEFKESLEKAVVDYYLHILRAQCYPQIRRSTLKLFNSGVLSLHRTNYTRVVVNAHAKLMNQRVLNEQDWQNYISAIFLAKFSVAFTSEKGNGGKSKSPNGKRISKSVHTLTSFVEKVLELLERKEFRRHAVKITCALQRTVGEWIDRAHKLVIILNIFCRACGKEREVNEGDMQHLILLNEYIRQGSLSITRGQALTFKQFYDNKSI